MRNDTRNKASFALVGLGFISERHIQAIEDVGGTLVAVCDVDKGKEAKLAGQNVKFFQSWTDLLVDQTMNDITHVAIATPNYLHMPMSNEFSRLGKQVICEKPLVITAHDLPMIHPKVKGIVQLRYNKRIQQLKESLDLNKQYEAQFAVHIHRDSWYFESWKADKQKSGGVLFNIGVHYFDLLCYLFGKPTDFKLYHLDEYSGKGVVNFGGHCTADWSLTIKAPMDNQYRFLKVNGESINLTKGMERLHTTSYKEILKGRGFGPLDLAPAIKLVEEITNA